VLLALQIDQANRIPADIGRLDPPEDLARHYHVYIDYGKTERRVSGRRQHDSAPKNTRISNRRCKTWASWPKGRAAALGSMEKNANGLIQKVSDVIDENRPICAPPPSPSPRPGPS